MTEGKKEKAKLSFYIPKELETQLRHKLVEKRETLSGFLEGLIVETLG